MRTPDTTVSKYPKQTPVLHSLRKKLLTFSLLLVVIPVLILGALIYIGIQRSAYEQSLAELELIVSDWLTICRSNLDYANRVLKREEVLVKQRLRSIESAVHTILDSLSDEELDRKTAFKMISRLEISRNGCVSLIGGKGTPLILSESSLEPEITTAIEKNTQKLQEGRKISTKYFIAGHEYLSVLSYHPRLDIYTSVNIGVQDYKSLQFEDKLRYELRFLIASQEIRENGYLFVINSKGEYIVSRNNLRDGESIIHEKTEDGREIVKEMITASRSLQAGEFAHFQYSWKNILDGQYYKRISVISTFSQWDWIIGAAMFHKDFLQLLQLLRNYIFLISFASIIAGGGIALFFSKLLTAPLLYLESVCRRAAKGDLELEIDRSIVSSRDEIASLANSFERMMRSISEARNKLQEEKRALKESEERFRQIIENASDIIFTCDLNGIVQEISKSWTEILGYSAGEIRGYHFNRFVHPEDKQIGGMLLERLLAGEKLVSSEYRAINSSGEVQWHTCNATLLRNEAGEAMYVIGIARDFTCQKERFEKLQSKAELDPLTELYNRRMLDKILKKELAAAARYKTQLSLIMIDIDYFKQVNDSYGHDTGDQALRQVAQLLSKQLRSSDSLARYGGEEFTVVAPNTDLDHARQLAEKLRLACEQSEFTSIGDLSLSLGVSSFSDGDSEESLVKRADRALYRAKKLGRNRVESQMKDV